MIGFKLRSRPIVASALAVSLVARFSWAEEDQAAAPELPPIAATVNGEPIFVGEIEAGMSSVSKLRQVNPEGIEHARASMLRDIINKRLIEQSLVQDGTYLDRELVDRELRKLESKLKNNRMTLEQIAAARGVTPDVARHEISWPMIWNKYLERHLADALEGYFNEHHKDLDGTQVHASHIWLRAEGARETKNQLQRRVEGIRDEIESKKMTFEQAAEKYSVGPSRSKGGDLGYFPRYGVMAEEFSKAAFALEPGEISRPITTNFGTHLIRVSDAKPGNTQWTEVIPQIKSLASRQLFDDLAQEQRKTAKIEYSGKAAHFNGDTDQLVLPGRTVER